MHAHSKVESGFYRAKAYGSLKVMSTTTTTTLDLASRIERMPGALKVSQLAALLGVGRTYMYEQIEMGRVHYYRLPSGAIRLDPARIAAWLREHEVGFDDADGNGKKAA